MLAFSFVQIVFAGAAVYYGAKAAMGFGRDLRRDLFHQVTAYSAREVGQFGAPSLITRITNDVQQVQMLVVLATTMMIAAPLTMVIGIDHGRARERRSSRSILLVRDPRRRDHPRARSCPDGAHVPADADPRRPGQRRAPRADHRHPRRAGVRARAGGDRAIRRRQRRTHRHRPAHRPPDGGDVPDGAADHQRVEHRRAVDRRRLRERAANCRSAR